MEKGNKRIGPSSRAKHEGNVHIYHERLFFIYFFQCDKWNLIITYYRASLSDEETNPREITGISYTFLQQILRNRIEHNVIEQIKSWTVSLWKLYCILMLCFLCHWMYGREVLRRMSLRLLHLPATSREAPSQNHSPNWSWILYLWTCWR